MGVQKPSMQLLADREQHYIHDAFGHARDCEGNRTKVELCEMSSACYYWHRQSSFKTNASQKVFLIIPSFYEIGVTDVFRNPRHGYDRLSEQISTVRYL